MRTFAPAAAVVFVCAAMPLIAQTQSAAPVQTPAPVQAPAAPAPGVQPPGVQPPGVQTPAAPAVQTPIVQTPTTQMPATGSPVPMTPQPPPPIADTDHGTAIVLLDRIQKLLDSAVAKGGQVTLDRGLVDEMRAEVTQVKMSLQAERP